MTRVDPSLDKPKPAHEFLSEQDKMIYEACTLLYYPLFEQPSYLDSIFVDDPETFKNTPIGLQVVGRTLEDEAVIGMTEIVDTALKAAYAKV